MPVGLGTLLPGKSKVIPGYSAVATPWSKSKAEGPDPKTWMDLIIRRKPGTAKLRLLMNFHSYLT